MALHNERGKAGENIARAFLEKKGFEVQRCNWRSGQYEIDIIATHEQTVHFIEVKTRHSLDFGYPEEAVTKKKFIHLTRAAAHFLAEYPNVLKIQYDILSILRLPGKATEYFLIEDVYM